MIFLRFLEDPGYQNGFAEEIGVSRSTVKKFMGPLLTFVLGNVVNKSKDWLVFPTGRKS